MPQELNLSLPDAALGIMLVAMATIGSLPKRRAGKNIQLSVDITTTDIVSGCS